MNKLPFIDALRGIAIFGVLIIHSAMAVEHLRPLGDHLTEWVYTLAFQGARGVQLFFIISSFTLCLSAERRKIEKKPVLNFFIRRIFRIAPLFYCGLIYYTLLPSILHKRPFPSIGHVLSTITFTNGWHPYWLNFDEHNLIVPGGWSVAVEMTFYFLFPFLFKQIKSLKAAMCLTLITLIISMALMFILKDNPLVLDDDSWELFLFFWFPNQFPIFSLGIVLYFIIRRLKVVSKLSIQVKRKQSIYPRLLLGLSIFLLVILPFGNYKLIPIHFIYGLDFVLLATCLALYPSKLIVNKFWCYLGKISFSGYITHFYVIGLVYKILHKLQLDIYLPPDIHFIFLVSITLFGTIVVSFFTYNFIEVPGQHVGRNLINHLESKSNFQADTRT
jgi:peptidoglycan/LPS O-acetylase OafA/YrhL